MVEPVDAIIIGAGEVGSIVASKALEAGKRVALIYKPPFGSTCLNTGCVPSKFMIHRARIAHLVSNAARYHVHAAELTVDLPGIVAEKDRLITDQREGLLRAARSAEGLTLVEGEARFRSTREVAVGDRLFRSETIVIATGMRPLIPEIEGLDQVEVLTNDNLMDLTEIPGHLICIGGGYISCELGQTFRRFGSEVTIIQSREHLCPEEEPDVSTILERAFEAEGIGLLLGYRAVRAEAIGAGVRITARTADGAERIVEGTHLLVAVGRQPNTDTLGLDAAGIDTDETGFVEVNEYLETNQTAVYAGGDVNARQPFTRVCQEEGKVIFANAFEGARIKMKRDFLGHAIFTDPAIGSVGLTEAQAREQGYEVAAGLVTFDKVSKARFIGETEGLMKYVVDRETRRILGCHVIGPDAENLIYDAVLVMRHGGTIDEIAKAVGIFPTLQEGMEGTARGVLRKIAPEEVAGPLVTEFAHP
jgi:pyruvate/2-oxoglutarate dehydrogenase complex dihydrolipoamide dehydrogenase (E3) component